MINGLNGKTLNLVVKNWALVYAHSGSTANIYPTKVGSILAKYMNRSLKVLSCELYGSNQASGHLDMIICHGHQNSSDNNDQYNTIFITIYLYIF